MAESLVDTMGSEAVAAAVLGLYSLYTNNKNKNLHLKLNTIKRV